MRQGLRACVRWQPNRKTAWQPSWVIGPNPARTEKKKRRTAGFVECRTEAVANAVELNCHHHQVASACSISEDGALMRLQENKASWEHAYMDIPGQALMDTVQPVGRLPVNPGSNDSIPSGFFPTSFEPVTHQDTTADNRQLFFAKASKSAGEDEIKLLFSEYGNVLDVIIFQSSQGSGTSKGCGLVTMSTHEEAASALTNLHGKFAWSNRDPPMVVTWMDAALQDPARQGNMQGARAGIKPNVLTSRPVEAAPEVVDTPPVGCDANAIKLFVGNIPLTYTEDQLLPLFQQIGPVVELVVVRNKLNSLSKGCAFVWYASRTHAEMAITALNLKHMLPDVQGVQHRPLVVRKARTGHMMGGMVQKSGSDGPSGVAGGFASGGLLRGPLTQRLFTPSSHPLLGRGGHAYMQQQLLQPQQQSQHLIANLNHWPVALSAPVTGSQGGQLQGGQIQHYAMPPGAGRQPLQGHSSYPLTLSHQYQGGLQHHTLGQNIELMQGQPITVQTVNGGTTTYVPVQSAQGPSAHGMQGLGGVRAVLGQGQSTQYHVQSTSQYQAQPAQYQAQPAQYQAQPQYQIVMDVGPSSMQSSMHNFQHIGLAPEPLEQYMPVQTMMSSVDPNAGQSSHSHGTLMALDSSQLAVVNDHLFSIQASSGCALMISPGGPGTFNLLLSGAAQQVERAQLMVASMLGGQDPNGEI